MNLHLSISQKANIEKGGVNEKKRNLGSINLSNGSIDGFSILRYNNHDNNHHNQNHGNNFETGHNHHDINYNPNNKHTINNYGNHFGNSTLVG